MASEPQQVSHANTRLESKTLPIFLRTFQPGDAPALARLVSDPRSATDPNIKPMEVSKAEGIITRFIDNAAKPTVLGPDGRVVSGPSTVNLVVVLKSDEQPEGEVIGLGGYGAIKDWERDGVAIRAGDVGALIDPKYWRKGYATETIKLGIDWGFSPASEGGPQLDLVTITTLSDNEAIIRLVKEKLKIKVEALERPAEFDEAKTELYWELKPEDWKR